MPAKQGDNTVSNSCNSLKHVRFTDQLLEQDTYITISFVITTELSLCDNKFLAKFLKKEHSENEIKIMYKFFYQLN